MVRVMPTASPRNLTQKKNMERDTELIITSEMTIDPQILRTMLSGRSRVASTNGHANGPTNLEQAKPPENHMEAPREHDEEAPAVLVEADVVDEAPPSVKNDDHKICPNTTDYKDPVNNYFSSDYTYPQGVQRGTAALGRDLYLRFLHEEIRIGRARDPPSMDPWRAARLDLDYSQSLNASVRVRKSLREVANAFACSEQREHVRDRAAEVDIESLDFNSFQELLQKLFREGVVTSERVVVLFYFCADLTIRALREQLTSCFHSLIEWSQLYIVNTLSVWVQQNGGWSAVLDQSANVFHQAAKITLICASIVALVIFIRRAR